VDTSIGGIGAGGESAAPTPFVPPTSVWAAPEERPAGASPSRASDPLGGPVRPVVVDPPVPVVLRPMTNVAIYDGAFEVLKARPRLLFGLSLAITAPVVVVARLVRGEAVRLDLASFVDAAGGSEGSVFSLIDQRPWSLVLGLGLEMLATFIVGVVVARAVASWYAGEDPSARVLARSVAARTWPLLGAFAVMVASKAVGLAVLCVGLVLPLTWFALLAPVIGVEQLGGWQAVTRSFRLVNLRFGRVLAPVVGIIVIDQTVRLALETIPRAVIGDLPGPLVEPLLVALMAVVGAVSNIVIGAAAVLIYLSVRVSTEGLDLELEATDVL